MVWFCTRRRTLSIARLAKWDRTRARCQPFGWYVSLARPPNRTCGFHRIRLSTSPSALRDLLGRHAAPWRGDRRPAVAVTGNRDCSAVEQRHAVVLGPPPVGQVAPSQKPPVGTTVL